MNITPLINDQSINLQHSCKETTHAFDTSEFNPELIGWYHKEMFRLHDLEEWDHLKRNAREMIVALGYDMESAEKASEFVLVAYQKADCAAKAQRSENTDEERIAYKEMLTNFVQASRSLRSETASIKYKMGWHKWARHKRPLLLVYHLFREHLKRFGILRLDVVISTTWMAFFGGYFAHKKHDWEKLERAMAKYWWHIHRAYKVRPPLQI